MLTYLVYSNTNRQLETQKFYLYATTESYFPSLWHWKSGFVYCH